MLEISGQEGGGQLLRSALALSMCTATPFRMTGIRAGRPRPGLMRQHLTAVQAAAAVCQAQVAGADLGSLELSFEPAAARGGDYRFAIGTAGSTTLVLQTVLPALLRASRPSTLRLEGGTHNPLAPPADFLMRTFAPLVRRMGATLTIELEQHGFYPAGGGVLNVAITPGELSPLRLQDRGRLVSRRARALVSSLPGSIAERELAVVARRLGLSAEELEHRSVCPAFGPGNVLMIELEFEHVTELFSGFGERGVSAEAVAEATCAQARAYLESGAAVGAHLADQLLLPLALAGGGRFSTVKPSEHFITNATLIEKFVAVSIEAEPDRGNSACWQVQVSA